MKKWLYFLTALLIFAVIYLNRGLNTPHDGTDEAKIFTVNRGDGVETIATRLAEEGFLAKPFLFKFYLFADGDKDDIWAGDYSLPKNLTVVELANALRDKTGVLSREVSITLIEGWRVDEIDAHLAVKGLISEGELEALSAVYDNADYDFLAVRPTGATLEGYLYPDTYRVFNSSDLKSVVAKILNNFATKISPELRAEMTKQGRSLHEVLTLASIVEAEMHGYENRRRVAGVFLSRLKIGMALQSDATVNYLTRSGRSRSTSEDLAIDNPYNTYKYPGLPPGPIGNPSLESIKAVLYPEITGELYFLTDADGGIHFAKTFEQHVANKQKYLY